MHEVHLSIDDVIGSLQQAATSQKGLNGSPIFRLLMRLHRLTGMKVTLFLFLHDGKGFGLEQVPAMFAEQPWIRFAFHGITPTNEPPEMTSDELDAAICKTHECIERFAGRDRRTTIIRMHFWQYPDNYLPVLVRNGYDTVLTRPCGDVRANEYKPNDIVNAWRTHVRIEQLSCREIIRAIRAYDKSDEKQPLVVFTHEWALARRRVVLRLIVATIILRIKKFAFI